MESGIIQHGFLNQKFLEWAVTESGEVEMYDLEKVFYNSALIFFLVNF